MWVARLAAAGLVCAAAFGAPVAAQIGAPGAAAGATADKKICRRMQVTGQLAPKRTCKTAAEWQAQANEASENAQRLMDDHINSCGATSPGDCDYGPEDRSPVVGPG